jgi:hypothetical protein
MAAVLRSQWDEAGEAKIAAVLFGENGAMASDWIPDEIDQKHIISAMN